MAPTKTTTQRGYGHSHRRIRQQLLYNMPDGAECEYCGQPMYKDPTKNFDGKPLNADHEALDKTKQASRLLHDQCNKKMNSKGRWVRHGPGWHTKHGYNTAQPTDLDWPHGTPITW